MLDKEVEQPNFVLPDLRDGLDDLVGDEIGATGPWLEGKPLLEPSHCTGRTGVTSEEREETEGCGPNEVKSSREQPDQKYEAERKCCQSRSANVGFWPRYIEEVATR